MWIIQHNNFQYLAAFSSETEANSAINLLVSKSNKDGLVYYNKILIRPTDCKLVYIPSWQDSLVRKSL
jgi:hypothetical protein